MGQSKGYGFVHYESDEAANMAIEKVGLVLISQCTPSESGLQALQSIWRRGSPQGLRRLEPSEDPL